MARGEVEAARGWRNRADEAFGRVVISDLTTLLSKGPASGRPSFLGGVPVTGGQSSLQVSVLGDARLIE